MGLPRPLSIAWRLRAGIKIDRAECGGVQCERLEWRESRETTLLYFHGGGYLCCTPQTHRPNSITLTRLLKAFTYVPDYRLAPEHPFPAGIDDALEVYRALSARSNDIVLAGDSAGGGLAIVTAIRARDNGLPAPSSILTFSPWVDLTPNREAQLRPHEHADDVFYAESFAAYSDAYLQGADPCSSLASPLFADLTNLPPLLIEVSDTEMLSIEAKQLRDGWAEAGNIVELNISRGLPHGWQEVTPFVPEARESLQRAGDFALRHL
jgi:acetyl esterase/lipase